MLRAIASFAVVSAVSAQSGKIASDAAGNIVLTPGSVEEGGNNVIFTMGDVQTSVVDLLSDIADLETGKSELENTISEMNTEFGGKLDQLEAKVMDDIGVKLTDLTGEVRDNQAQMNSALGTVTSEVNGKVDKVTRDLTNTINSVEGAVNNKVAELTNGYNAFKTQTEKALLDVTPVCPKPPPTVSGIKLAPVGAGASDYNKGFYPIGMKLEFKDGSSPVCPTKQYPTTGLVLECTGSKKWCQEGDGICASSQQTTKPKCGSCPSGCSKCTAKDNCQKCTTSGHTFVGGKCMVPNSCYKMFSGGGLNDGQTKTVTLQKIKRGGTVSVRCSKEGGRIHTMLKCRDLIGGGSCRNFRQFTSGNTCKDYGYENMPFRNQAHWRMGWDTYGGGTIRGYNRHVGGVYKSNHRGNYVGCAMRSGQGHCDQWRAPDNKLWFVKNSRFSEPNGDYHANCLLGTYGWDRNDGMRFNDGWCGAWSGSSYFCGTSDYDGKGFPSN